MELSVLGEAAANQFTSHLVKLRFLFQKALCFVQLVNLMCFNRFLLDLTTKHVLNKYIF